MPQSEPCIYRPHRPLPPPSDSIGLILAVQVLIIEIHCRDGSTAARQRFSIRYYFSFQLSTNLVPTFQLVRPDPFLSRNKRLGSSVGREVAAKVCVCAVLAYMTNCPFEGVRAVSEATIEEIFGRSYLKDQVPSMASCILIWIVNEFISPCV